MYALSLKLQLRYLLKHSHGCSAELTQAIFFFLFLSGSAFVCVEFSSTPQTLNLLLIYLLDNVAWV